MKATSNLWWDPFFLGLSFPVKCGKYIYTSHLPMGVRQSSLYELSYPSRSITLVLSHL